MNDFLKDVIKETGNEYAGIVSDGVEAGDHVRQPLNVRVLRKARELRHRGEHVNELGHSLAKEVEAPENARLCEVKLLALGLREQLVPLQLRRKIKRVLGEVQMP